MHITEVRMRRLEGSGRTRAVASLTFDDSFVIHEIRLMRGANQQMVLSMPNRRLPGGDELDIAHPINSETRDYITDELLRVYEAAVNEGRRQYRVTAGQPSR